MLPITRFRFRSRSKVFGGQFSPASLFAAGEQGTWYDPSDLTTLFEDAAGTTPVPSVLERPVGLMLDKSGRGNHAYQTTPADRPTLSARYNLLTKTEQFNDAAWTKNGTTVGAVAATAPDGTLTAKKLIEDALNAGHQILQSAATTGTQTTFSVSAKSAERTRVVLGINDSTNTLRLTWFNLANGTVGTTGSGITAQISDSGSGWYRCAVTVASAYTGTSSLRLYTALSDGTTSYQGDGTSGIYVWGADLRPTNDGVGIPAYQRVNTATDYDTTGFPPYLAFNGSTRWMQTNTITPGTDKAQVFAGVRKLTDGSSAGVVAELSASTAANNGSFHILVPDSGVTNYGFASRGTVRVAPLIAGTVPVESAVLTLQGSISAPLLNGRRNGSQILNNTGDQGTGNFLAYPLYIGRRGGTSLPYNGRIYSLIARFGPNLTAAQIASTETYVNTKTKAY